MVMAPIDKRGPVFGPKAPTPLPGKLGGPIGTKPAMPGDEAVLTPKAVTPEQVAAAFERVDQAKRKVLATSMGTLGALPAHKAAIAELKAAQAELQKLREAAPALVEAEEQKRHEAAREQKSGFFDFVKKWFLFPIAPVPTLLFNLFKKD